MKIGIAADHGGFELKEKLKEWLLQKGYNVKDFGAWTLDTLDDYPDFIVPLARSVASGEVEKAIAICGSGVGASIAANKIYGVKAALIHDHFSAHQGVEDDEMNMICLGGRVTGYGAAEELIEAFLKATFSGLDRHKRRIAKVNSLTNEND